MILTEDGGATPPPPHAQQVPVVKDMLHDGRSGLTKAIVMGPSWAVLFYGRQSLGGGLSLGKVRDTVFILSGAISWFGKQAQLNTNPLSQQEGQQLFSPSHYGTMHHSKRTWRSPFSSAGDTTICVSQER